MKRMHYDAGCTRVVVVPKYMESSLQLIASMRGSGKWIEVCKLLLPAILKGIEVNNQTAEQIISNSGTTYQ